MWEVLQPQAKAGRKRLRHTGHAGPEDEVKERSNASGCAAVGPFREGLRPVRCGFAVNPLKQFLTGNGKPVRMSREGPSDAYLSNPFRHLSLHQANL